MKRTQKAILAIVSTFSIGVMVASYASGTGTAQDFSALSTAELTKFKLEEMGEDDLKAFRAEIQKRSMDLCNAEKETSAASSANRKKARVVGKGKVACRAAWGGGTELKPYIDAHEKCTETAGLECCDKE